MQAARGAPLTGGRKLRRGLILGIAITAWAADLITKQLAESRLAGREPVEVVGSLLRLNLTHNSGAAFSTGPGLTLFFSIFAIVALAVSSWFAWRARSLAWAWALGLLLAGIAGNLTDRLFREPGPLRGHVVDFLQLPNWPVFNVADICINIAAGLIILQSFRGVRVSGERHERDPSSGGSQPRADAGAGAGEGAEQA